MRALLVATLLLGACDPPTPVLHYRLDDTSVGQCPSADCVEISATCRKWLGIRIIDPAKPLSPYLDQCDEIPNEDLCGIGGIDLKKQSLPLRDLEVQVAVFPESMVTKNDAGEWLCPTTTQYDASSGFPVSSDQTPSVGGRGFYHPGDDSIVVNLGCTDLAPLQACGSADEVLVTARVEDFEQQIEFTGAATVAVGEPQSTGEFHALPPTRLTALTFDGTTKRWKGVIPKLPPTFACLTVAEDIFQSTTAVVCYDPATGATRLDWPTTSVASNDESHVSSGVRLTKAALDQMLAALAINFPQHGMTIGLVLDSGGGPVANVAVTAQPPGKPAPPTVPVSYFSSDRTGLDLGTRTTTSGAFVTLDAPFGTKFSATIGLQEVARIGGRIDSKVTIVILQPSGGGNN